MAPENNTEFARLKPALNRWLVDAFFQINGLTLKR